MKINTMGLGYIGLPTSIMFAKHGVEVVGIDVNEKVIESLNSVQIHIEEPGLQDALEEVVEAGLFKASLHPEPADAFIVAVPTPRKQDQSCDLKYVISAVESILPVVSQNNTIIIESTIEPRTMDDVIKPLFESHGYTIGEDLYLVHCPERVLPGNIMYELIYNNRIVGGITEECCIAGEKVYRTFVEGEIIKTDAKTAEMSKLMENTYRDVNIALSNELTKICNELSINVLDVIEMSNKHPRVNLHSPGPGVGGHCLAVDPYFVISKARETAELIQLSRDVNNSMPSYIEENIVNLLNKVDGNKLTILGVTYKGNVDDIRESPALEIIKRLSENHDFQITIHDPHVNLPYIEKDINKATADADLIVVLSDHNEFKNIELEDNNQNKDMLVFDTKNIVKTAGEDLSIVTLGTLHEYLKKELVLQ